MRMVEISQNFVFSLIATLVCLFFPQEKVNRRRSAK